MADAPESIEGYRHDIRRALKLIDDKAPDYRKGQEYYDGRRAEVSASKAVQKLIEKSAEAAPVSLAHIPVDVLCNKVNLASLTAAEPVPAALLTTVIDDNDLEDEFDDWLVKAGYFGDYYAIVDVLAEFSDGRASVDDLRVVGSSPLTTVVVYDRKDARTPLYGFRRWEGGGRQWHALLYYDDVTVRLVTQPGVSTPRAEDFMVDDDGEDDGERIPHEGGRMLISHLAVGGKPYGVPLHRKAWGPQDAITKVSAVNLSNVDGQGYASRWALADPMAEIDDDIDDDFGYDGPGTQDGSSGTGQTPDGLTRATTGSTRVRSIPGAIALLRGVSQTGQYDATETDNFLKNLDWYVRVMAVATGIPLFEFDLKGEQPSGESRRRASERANRTARKVARAAEVFLKNLGDTILATLGATGTVSATFEPFETSTDKEGIELVALKVKNGVPVRQALLEAGYTDEQVEKWWPGEGLVVTYDVVLTLAQALAQLGTAKTLGVITDDELRDMLPTIITAARNEGPRPTSIEGVVKPARPLAIEA